MEEPIFITYANTPLKDNPEIFYDLYEYFDNLIERPTVDGSSDRFLNETKEIVKYFIKFVKANDLRTAQNILKKECEKLCLSRLKEWEVETTEKEIQECVELSSKSTEFTWEVHIAFGAVFGYRANYCEHGESFDFCPKFVQRVYAFDRKLLRGSNRLKCYECDQMMLKKILDGLTRGLEYRRIPERFNSEEYYVTSFENDGTKYIAPGGKRHGKLVYWVRERHTLTDFLMRTPRTVMKKVFYLKGDLPFRERFLELQRVVIPDWVYSRQRKAYGAKRPTIVIAPFFGELFFETIVGYSLADFLLKNDRRKLKKCPYCEKFFIAKDIKRKICYSQACKREYERVKKAKQRESDPVKYY